jgi:acetyl esterase/lipase
MARFAEVQAQLPPARARQDYPGLTSYYEIPFAEVVGFRPLALDLHIPNGHGPHPVVVWVHGGGWQGGRRGMGHAVDFAQYGYAVAAVQYRFSGEARFPAQVHDVKGAVRWLRAHAATYRLDADRVAGWGASAGGFLISLVALTSEKAEWEGDVGGNLEQSSRLQCVVDYFGVSDLLALASPSGDTVVDQLATNLLGYGVRQQPESARQASPVAHATSTAPPFLLLHGDEDPLVPQAQSESLHIALNSAGAESSLIILPGAVHEDAAFWTDQTLRQVREFLEHTLTTGVHQAASTS